MQFTDVVCRVMTSIEYKRVNLHHGCGVFIYISHISEQICYNGYV